MASNNNKEAEKKEGEKKEVEKKEGGNVGKRVEIQSLARTGKDYPAKQSPRDQWLTRKCPHEYGKCDKCVLLTYEENVAGNVESYGNRFYGAFVEAYNSHRGLILSPDDVWLLIILRLSKYIDTNAEKMRSMFVEHDGKKKLVVKTDGELEETKWDEFFTLIIGSIKENVKPGVVETLQNDFSTTGRLERIVSTAAIMNSFKKYFEYGRMIPCCGITHVDFLGTADDWANLPKRLSKLEKYDVDGTWKKYVTNLIPVLQKLNDTYNGRVDVDWWNHVMNFTHGQIGSGSTTYVSGWILAFYGLTTNKRVEVAELEEPTIDVPIEIDNRITGVVKTVNLVGGFGGIHLNDNSFRPQTSFAIIHTPPPSFD